MLGPQSSNMVFYMLIIVVLFVLVLLVVKFTLPDTSLNCLSVIQGASFIFAYLILFLAGRLTDNTSQLALSHSQMT